MKYSILGCLAVLLSACGDSYQSIESHLSIKPSNFWHINTDQPYYPLLVSNKTFSLQQLSSQGIAIPDKLTVNGKNIKADSKISIGDLYSDDLHKLPFMAQKNGYKYSGELYIYQKPFAMVIADRILTTDDPAYTHKKGQMHINIISGLPIYDYTQREVGNAISYKGLAFFRDQKGQLTYNIKFNFNKPDQSYGYGQITGLSHYGNINLGSGLLGNNSAKDSGINFQGNSLEGVNRKQQLALQITGTANNTQGDIGPYSLGLYGSLSEIVANTRPTNIMGGIIDKKTQEHIFFGGEEYYTQ